MGTVHHHAIVLTSSLVGFENAHTQAIAIFGPDAVSSITPKTINGYRSFFVAPDGSKEFWAESDAGDAHRAQFFDWLRDNEGLCGWPDWAEVGYGELGYSVNHHRGQDEDDENE